MLPVEILVRITTADPDSFGSGILIGREHVLTCAHVIDPNHAIQVHGKNKVRMTNSNEGFQHNRDTEQNNQGKEFSIRIFDGGSYTATFLAIHQHLDLVLLKLAKPVCHPIHIPQLQTDFRATTSHEVVGLGFLRTSEEHYKIQRERLELNVSDSETLSAQTSILKGQAIEGMSGGPAIMARQDKGLQLIGMLAMGSSTVSTCSVIRADVLANFLRSHLGDEISKLQTTTEYGLRPNGECHLPGLGWLRLKDATSHVESHEPEFARFIASRPLTFADIDVLTNHSEEGKARMERERFFAPMSAREAQDVIKLMSSRFGDVFSAPDQDARLLLPPKAEEVPPVAGNHPTRLEAILPPEWKPKSTSIQNKASFVSSGALEWVQSRQNALHPTYEDPQQGGYHHGAFMPGLSQTGAKALLRPVLSIPVWKEAQ